MRNQLHIMAVGAHILDAELTCGKTLAKHAMMGDKITTVAITAAEGGHPAVFSVEEFRKINIEGATKFAEELGGKFICMNYLDANVPQNEEIFDDFADIIRREKPDIILTHWDGSYHEDHIIAPIMVRKGVRRAAFSSGDLPPHSVKKILYAENWEDMKDFVPYVYVDVTDSFDLWHKAIQHIYLATHAKYFDYLGYYDTLSRLRGILAAREMHDCVRAECFCLGELDHFRLTDMHKNLSDIIK